MRNSKNVRVSVLVAFTLGCTQISNGSDQGNINMEKSPVSVKLEVAPTSDNLVATLTFQNVSDRTIYLDKYTACLTDDQTMRLFEITDRNGRALKYTGVMIKRKYSKNDFVGLERGNNLKATIVLSKWYEFYDGSHEYSVTYKAFNHSFEKEELFKMVSNTIVATYKK